MPKIVARRLEKVQRDFLWGGGNVERKTHLIKWEVICEDKNKGGLGLSRLIVNQVARRSSEGYLTKKLKGASQNLTSQVAELDRKSVV